MTTDRTAAATRSTALAPPAGRTPAPPADMFSALLGAATPESDAPARREDTPRRDDGTRADRPRRDDRPRADRPHRPDDARRSQPRDDAPKPAKADDEPTTSDATAASEAPVSTEPADETPTAPTTPSLFALQMA